MAWINPLPMTLVPDRDPEGFRNHAAGTTGLPIGDRHPGAFGFVRANHVHEGVDLYCPDGTPVVAVEDGTVVAVIDFTGTKAQPPSPWWRDTQAVLIEGESGVVVYGEIETELQAGDRLRAGDRIGVVRTVLTKDKGRPMAMLHLERHVHGTRDAFEWTGEGGRPPSLLDPTHHLLDAVSDQDERLHLSKESDASGDRYRLDLVTPTSRESIGTIRATPRGPWTWTVGLSGPGAPFRREGVAFTPEIARDRQFAALEEHDTFRFRRPVDVVRRIRSALEILADAPPGIGGEGYDAASAIAEATPEGIEPRSVLEHIHVVMPELVELEAHVALHGRPAPLTLALLARKAIERLDRLYPDLG